MRLRACSFSTLVTIAAVGCGDNTVRAPPPPDPHLLAEGSTGTATVYIPGVGPQTVTYVVQGGLAIHSGDLAIRPEDLSGLADPRTTAAGRRFEQYRWNNAMIPYEIDPSVGPGPTTALIHAFAAWSASTPIIFTQHVPGTGGDYVYYQQDRGPGTGGVSDGVGRVGGKQVVHLNSDANDYVAAHETGHVIGFYHEQSRVDRDSAIIVNNGVTRADGITPPDLMTPCGVDKGGFVNYQGLSPGPQGNDGVDLAPGFDFGSIMLYAAGSGCGPGPAPSGCNRPCITKLDGSIWSGPPAAPSAQDIDGVNRTYLRFTDQAYLGDQTIINDLAVTTWGGGRVDVLGIDAYLNQVFHRWSSSGPTGLSSAETWGGGPAWTGGGGIDAVAWGSGRLDWVTVSQNSTVVHGWYDGTIHWEDTGFGPVVGTPTISSQGPNKLDVFVVYGGDGSNRIYQRSWNNGWSSWFLTNGATGFSGGIDAVSWGPGRIDIAATSSDHQLKHLWWWSGGSWQVETLADAVQTVNLVPVSAASWGPGRLDIIYNSNGAARRLSFEGSWGKSMPVVPHNVFVGDAVARVNGTDSIIDYVYLDNSSAPGLYKYASARR
jgi:hypothetical protein